MIGSLFAGHLAQVSQVSVLTRRPEHAEALMRDGLRVSGKSELHANVVASTDPGVLPPPDVAIVATKAAGLRGAMRTLEGHFTDAALTTVLNGLGAEEIVREHGDWPIVSGVTFMSGTRHSDTHVEYILDTETWLGPYEETQFELVREIADAIVASGLKAEALPDLRPGAVVEASVQRRGEPRRGSDRPPARSPLRGGGGAGRPRAPRTRARGRGEGGRGGGRGRAPRRPVGDERARDEARIGALSVDARGRRRAPADGDRSDHGCGRARGDTARRLRFRCTRRSWRS